MAMRECPECGVRLDVSERFYAACNGWRRVKCCPNCYWTQPVGPVFQTASAAKHSPPTPQAAQWAVDSGEWR
jgi:hypothetical protein